MCSSQSGHSKLEWMRRRCMPTECPKQSVTALVAKKSSNALDEKYSGPKTRAIAVIVPSQSDFAGAHRTSPSSGLVRSSAKIRCDPGWSCMRYLGRPCFLVPGACIALKLPRRVRRSPIPVNGDTSPLKLETNWRWPFSRDAHNLARMLQRHDPVLPSQRDLFDMPR